MQHLFLPVTRKVICIVASKQWWKRAVRISRARRSGFQTLPQTVACCVVATSTWCVGGTTVADVE